MYDRKKRIMAVTLLIGAAILFVGYGLRSVSDRRVTFHSSGRNSEVIEISMPDGTVSINEADAEELTALYGIGETLASMIIDERETNGPFRYPEDLTAVKGIGIKKMNGFRESINLE